MTAIEIASVDAHIVDLRLLTVNEGDLGLGAATGAPSRRRGSVVVAEIVIPREIVAETERGIGTGRGMASFVI